MSAQQALAPLRATIDALDAAMVDLLAQRFAVVRAVVERKASEGIAARLDDRVEAVVAHVRAKADAAGCPPDLAEHVWRAMIDWIIGFEEKHLGESATDRAETR